MDQTNENEMSVQDIDALYQEIMEKVESDLYSLEVQSVDKFLSVHQIMQMDANSLVNAHPMGKDLVYKLKRFENDPEKRKEILKNVHLPGAKPQECKYCAYIVKFYEYAIAFERRYIGVDRNIDEKRGDAFRHQIQIAKGVYKMLEKEQKGVSNE